MIGKQFPRVIAAVVVASLFALPGMGHAHHAGSSIQAAEVSDTGIVFKSGFALPATTLFAMKANDSFAVEFPLLGGKTIVHESHTDMVNGVAYWHGHLAGDRSARVTLRFDGQTFVGAIRYNGGEFALEQTNSKLSVQPGKQAKFEAQQGDVAGYLADKNGKPVSVRPGMYQINLSVETLMNTQPNEMVQLPLPDGSKLPLVFTGRDVGHEGAVDWYGYSRDDGQAFQATLTMGPDAVFGVITTPKTVYRLETESGRTYLVDVKAAGYKTPDHRHYDLNAPTTAAAALVDQVKAMQGAATTVPAQQVVATAANTVAPTVDVLVLYSSTFRQTLGDTGFPVRIQNIFAIANRALADSQVNGKLRPVFQKEIAYADNDNGVALGDLQANRGLFAGIEALRTQTGADLVTFFRPFNYAKSGGSCGVGYVLGANLRPDLIPLQKGYAYTVVSDGRDKATSYYCDDTTFAHEVGHNFGAMHDLAHSGTGKGAYQDSYGYGVSGKFGDVMSYYWPKVGVYSNPNLKVCANQACGSAQANVARTMQLNFKAVSEFRAAVPAPTPVSLAGSVLDRNTRRVIANATITTTDAKAKCTIGNNGLFTCTTVSGASGVITIKVAGRIVEPASYSYNAIKSNIAGLMFTVR
ncbi:hypothetical protein HNQ59_000750 [Chitinivorax tropicus]|uniref:Reprolysin-like metallo-peptidase family M12B n=1 Tax=Chitinivorax tropicus TaxID=714531 RepID=A0A840MLS5_9PROT|nr:M12 family metallo-peptidase [Chitinivorax tropicus]MBB5017486.1 hypothetical protein [Chitinivorax tropicus]